MNTDVIEKNEKMMKNFIFLSSGISCQRNIVFPRDTYNPAHVHERFKRKKMKKGVISKLILSPDMFKGLAYFKTFLKNSQILFLEKSLQKKFMNDMV